MAADNIELQRFSPGNEGLLGKEGISNDAVRQLKKVILERVYGSQINANEGVMIIHVLEIIGNGTPYFVSKGLLGHKVNSRPGIGIN